MSNDEHVTRAILKAIDNGDLEGYQPRSYSGRAMYGRDCLGIIVARHEILKVVGRLVHAIHDFADDDTIADLLEQDPCQDSMGMDAIVYFPRLPWVDVGTDPDEEDEEPASMQAG